MINPHVLEEAYKSYTKDINQATPDGVIPVNLPLLHEMGILQDEQKESIQEDDDSFSQYFHVIETEEKVTLFNEQFAIWITPQNGEQTPSTLTFIAMMQEEKPRLEVVFSASGVYNSPKYILKVLQHFLKEMVDTESFLSSVEENEG